MRSRVGGAESPTSRKERLLTRPFLATIRPSLRQPPASDLQLLVSASSDTLRRRSQEEIGRVTLSSSLDYVDRMSHVNGAKSTSRTGLRSSGLQRRLAQGVQPRRRWVKSSESRRVRKCGLGLQPRYGSGCSAVALRRDQGVLAGVEGGRPDRGGAEVDGGSANVTAKQVDKLSASLMEKSGVDDEVIQSGENMLLTFTKIRNEAGKGNDIFNQATKAT